MRYQIAIITLFGILSGCSDSDAPEGPSQDQPSQAQTEAAGTDAARDTAPAEKEVQVQPEQPPNLVRFKCNDGAIFEAELVDQGIIMVINDISYDLRQQPASSGTLYADDSVSFHITGDQALLTDEQGTVECLEVEAALVGQGEVPEPIILRTEGNSNQGD